MCADTNLTYEESAIYREILQQPDMWMSEYRHVLKEKKQIANFLSKHLYGEETELILTGAGSSAFIGDVLTGIFIKKGFNCRAVATTDIITQPDEYFSNNKHTMLVSFARSGNSPESLAAVQMANRYCPRISHIIITCNQNGELVRYTDKENTLLLLLPPQTNDVSLAMTSSFTTMALACLLLANINGIERQQPFIEEIGNFANHIFNHYTPLLAAISERNFQRAVFLGSGSLKGIAEECHLKLQELTDGAVICKYDSFLGFRHGPKAVINPDTILIYLFSDNSHIQQYERDLVKQINSNNKVVAQIAVSTQGIDIPGVEFDLKIQAKTAEFNKDNEYAFIPYVLIGQLLGYYKSLDCGLNPDNPSVSGNISRVVTGVKIYNYES